MAEDVIEHRRAGTRRSSTRLRSAASDGRQGPPDGNHRCVGKTRSDDAEMTCQLHLPAGTDAKPKFVGLVKSETKGARTEIKSSAPKVQMLSELCPIIRSLY